MAFEVYKEEYVEGQPGLREDAPKQAPQYHAIVWSGSEGPGSYNGSLRVEMSASSGVYVSVHEEGEAAYPERQAALVAPEDLVGALERLKTLTRAEAELRGRG